MSIGSPVRTMRVMGTILPMLAGVLLSCLAGQAQLSEGTPTYYRDVLPILQKHCEVCHRAGGIAPISFADYEMARRYAEPIRFVTENKSMPPWFAVGGIGRFSNDPSLSGEEIATLAARGEVDYTYEIVPTHFGEDRWVQMAEVLPSARANVHHAVVYIRPPNSNWLRHAPVGKAFMAETLTDAEDRRGAHWTDSDVLLVYAPGSSPDEWPATMAKFVPAGSDLVFQMHYTTNGKSVEDQSSVGMVFAKQLPTQRVLTLQLTNDHFVIPPGADNFRVEARGTLPNDAMLLSFFPHMHLRGKRFEYNLLRHTAAQRSRGDKPGGAPKSQIETLLRVNYHFHWQMSYRLTEPRLLKAGTELQAVAWYDNSANNPHNPDPTAAVRWGEQTYDEMMIGFFDVAVAAGMDKGRYFLRH